MNVDEVRLDLSLKGKNGIAFLLSAIIIWLLITTIYLLPISLQAKNIFMLLLTGMLFPIAVGMSRLIKSDWKLEHNPLNKLGLSLNFAQFIYFPMVFWAFIDEPEKMIVFFAVITGAHFFPYGWFYQAIGYYVMAPVIAVAIMLIGWLVNPAKLWIVPLTMLFSLIVLVIWLHKDYKVKYKSG